MQGTAGDQLTASEQWEFWDYDCTSWDHDDHDHEAASTSDEYHYGPELLSLEHKPISNLSSYLEEKEHSNNNHLFAPSMFQRLGDWGGRDTDDISVDSERTARASNRKTVEGRSIETSTKVKAYILSKTNSLEGAAATDHISRVTSPVDAMATNHDLKTEKSSLPENRQDRPTNRRSPKLHEIALVRRNDRAQAA